ncbi:hypothetical protein LSAT2_005165 [Lamellibrachia satsuma]|nr:hypothetical protein LSAT2_005165 [Lamellibrachia satsuma]
MYLHVGGANYRVLAQERLSFRVRTTELGAGGDVGEQRQQQLQEREAVGDVEGDDVEHIFSFLKCNVQYSVVFLFIAYYCL